MDQVQQADAEGVAVAHGEDDLLLAGDGDAQAAGDGVGPAVGAGKAVALPGGERLAPGAADGGPPDHVRDLDAELGDGLDDDLVVNAQSAAGTGRRGNFPGAQVLADER